MLIKLLRLVLLAGVLPVSVLAQEKPAGAPPAAPPGPADRVSVTRHSLRLAGQTLHYTATAGYMPVKSETNALKAKIFFTAYVKEGVSDRTGRPVTFTFNGGPGSSSVWLHLGTIGPRRVQMSPEGEALPPPGELIDNESTWLDFTDLVFIDPVMTGYSRPAEGEDKKQFLGVEEDAKSVGEFIRLYCTQYKRWGSPKFLAGESYGTTRAARLSGYLQDTFGMYLNGIVLISAITQFQTARFDTGNDWPYILFLPTYTATAWYHKKLPEDLQRQPLAQVLQEVENWALTDYLLALAQGDRLPEVRREQITAALARYTGLSEQYIRNTNMRILIRRFTKELLRTERQTVGRLDSRFQGIDLNYATESYEFDPSYAAIYGPFSAALNHYVRTELGYENDIPYEILTGRVQPWNWGKGGNGYLNVAETLRQAMSKNKYLKVFIANGYYDLATPFFATRYTVEHMGLDPSLRDHISFGYYEAGHMMYIHQPSRQKLTADVAAFYRTVLAAAGR